jgi:hypothetical protein
MIETSYDRAEMIQRCQSLLNEGWIWRDDLRTAIPPGTDDKGIQFRHDFQADQIAKGYVWNQRYGGYVPPTWTHVDLDEQLVQRAKSAARMGKQQFSGLSDWLQVVFLLLFGLLVFGQNPFVGIVVIAMGVVGFQETHKKHR